MQSRSYDAANQVVGWSYDAAGNLLSDGSSSSTYDALNRLASQGGTSYAYNGDGVLVAQTVGITTTHYTQDLVAPLSQMLSVGDTIYFYGHERLTGQVSGTTTWYSYDGLGSVRQTLDAAGAPLDHTSYDPWGVPQGNAVAPFGFTGELQDAQGMVYLRARWYTPSNGAFTSRDPFAGFPEQPYSLGFYQYAYSSPVNHTDPTGKVVYLFEGGWNEPSAPGAANPSNTRQIMDYLQSRGVSSNT